MATKECGACDGDGVKPDTGLCPVCWGSGIATSTLEDEE